MSREFHSANCDAENVGSARAARVGRGRVVTCGFDSRVALAEGRDDEAAGTGHGGARNAARRAGGVTSRAASATRTSGPCGGATGRESEPAGSVRRFNSPKRRRRR
jgi:hypothetical protein